MDLTSLKTIKSLLDKYHTKPIKYMGQNFLINQKVLEKIIESAQLSKYDTILEVGPGIGILTKELAERAKRVIAIEKDKRMVQILKETLKEYQNIEIIQGNILKLDPKRYTLNAKRYKIVANIPYYLTSPLIRKSLEERNKPECMVLMVQKEVAQRICAKPPHMSLLAVSVQFYSEPKIISYVKKESFWPKPKIDSAIIKITPFGWAHSDFVSQRQASAFSMLFFKIVKAGFSQPRKQLINNLSRGLKKDKENVERILLKNGIQPNQRAETLSVEDWMRVTEYNFTHSF